MAENRFYVYKLIDPRNRRVFYIGKGKQRRAWHHANKVARGKSSGNEAKDARIAKILARGMEPIVDIVETFINEADAFKLEIELIASTPGICNIRKGGEGRSVTSADTERQNWNKARAKEIKRMRRLKEWVARAETWPHGCTIPGHPNGDALGAWYLETVRKIISREPRPYWPDSQLSQSVSA